MPWLDCPPPMLHHVSYITVLNGTLMHGVLNHHAGNSQAGCHSDGRLSAPMHWSFRNLRGRFLEPQIFCI